MKLVEMRFFSGWNDEHKHSQMLPQVVHTVVWGYAVITELWLNVSLDSEWNNRLPGKMSMTDSRGKKKKKNRAKWSLHWHVVQLTCLVVPHCLTQLTALHICWWNISRQETSRQVIHVPSRLERYDEFKKTLFLSWGDGRAHRVASNELSDSQLS